MNFNTELKFDKESLAQIFSWFQPTLHHPSCSTITLNIDDLPSERQLASSLKQFNLYRMSGLVATSKSQFLYEDVMILIREFLHEKEVDYDSIQKLWHNSYIQQLKQCKAEDDFDIMYYDHGSLDYLWSFHRLRNIRDLLHMLEDKSKS